MNCKSIDFNNLKIFLILINIIFYYHLIYILDSHGKIILIHQIVL